MVSCWHGPGFADRGWAPSCIYSPLLSQPGVGWSRVAFAGVTQFSPIESLIFQQMSLVKTEEKERELEHTKCLMASGNLHSVTSATILWSVEVTRSAPIQGVEKWIVLFDENICNVTLHNVWVQEEAELGPFFCNLREPYILNSMF